MKKVVLIAGGIFLFILIVGLFSSNSSNTGNTGTKQAVNVTENNSQSAIEKAVKDVVDEQHLKELRVVPVEDNYALPGGKYNVIVEFYEDEAREQAANAVKLKTTEIFASLFVKDLGVNEARTMAWYPRGSNPEMVLKARMDREIAQKLGKESKMVFQYDAERNMVIEKSSYPQLPVSNVTAKPATQNLQGTDKEKEIFEYAMNLYDKYSAQMDSYEAERRSTQETATRFGISTDEVEKIVYKLQ